MNTLNYLINLTLSLLAPNLCNLHVRRRDKALGAVAEHLMGGQTLTARLFSLNFVQQFTQTHASPVQLRLRNTYRAPQHLCDLMVFIPLDIVQNKYGAIAHRQLREQRPRFIRSIDPSRNKSGPAISMLDEPVSLS
jgi:hypothetical protein